MAADDQTRVAAPTMQAAQGLFDIDDIPEVPLFREPRRKGPAAGSWSDARFKNDYPPSWHRCETCGGDGWTVEAQHDPSCDGDCDNCPVPAQVTCGDCLGMGSLKARVRLEAGHRCVRCGHPYMPKGDAKMLGVEPTPFRWSPCDEGCTHGGPISVRFFGKDDPLAEPAVFCPTPGQTFTFNGRHFDGWTGPSAMLREKGVVSVSAEWRILTVHHLDGDKANCRWWNLAALCQRCHLEIQGKVVMERVWPHEHSEWFRPYVAGYYASVYLGEDLSRAQVEERMDELLALERIA